REAEGRPALAARGARAREPRGVEQRRPAARAGRRRACGRRGVQGPRPCAAPGPAPAAGRQEQGRARGRARLIAPRRVRALPLLPRRRRRGAVCDARPEARVVELRRLLEIVALRAHGRRQAVADLAELRGALARDVLAARTVAAFAADCEQLLAGLRRDEAAW